MSEEDAEIALLHQMQAEQATEGWGEGGDDQASGEESNTEHNIETVKKENVADDHILRAMSSSGADDTATADNGDLRSSATPQPTISLAVPESRSSSRSSVRKPKTVGGFVADDSDEDEDEDASSSISHPTALQVPSANATNRALSPSPLHNSVTQEEVSALDEGAGPKSGSIPSSSLPINPSGGGAVSLPIVAAQVNSVSSGLAQPKARLPHDTLGLLEDRIKDDPRGDLDAWMTLVSEYRSRSKFDEARDVYERFLKVFPQAVSSLLFVNNRPI
jgi:cleavage stimulation factor subunit 3